MSAAMLFGTAFLGLVVSPLSAGASGGFDQYGYNNGARIFNGTYLGWCEAGAYVSDCATWLGSSANDQLIMKWNAAWDTCNASYTNGGDPATACVGAWLDNEINGIVPGGDGSVWHYKIVYSSTCANDGTPSNGGYCVWNNYEVIMDQGTFDGTHTFYALATPNGYGAYK
ncbi:MAG: hypothetical protein ACYC5Z_05945 [Acidimicrobiales bacterium]